MTRRLSPACLPRHGHSSSGGSRKPSPTYSSWSSMIARCYEPRCNGYERYGGRGITVSDRWRGDGGFERFLADVGERPSRAHSLDRIDNDRPYEPGNVRWVTPKEQQRNRRDNVRVSAFGREATLAEWSERTGIPDYQIARRLKSGWPAEQALTQTTDRNQYIEHAGERLTRAQWASRLGLDVSTITFRLNHGWSEVEAVTTPKRGRRPGRAA